MTANWPLLLPGPSSTPGHYDDEATAAAYGAWLRSGPFDCGNTTAQALGPASDADDGLKAKAARSLGQR